MKKILIIIFISISLALSSGDLKFFREDIEFELKGNTFYVNGVYSFRNESESPMRRMLFYPYPLDALYSNPDSSFALSIIDGKDCKNHETAKGFTFAVKIPPDSIQSYRLGYQQRVSGKSAEYILTSTQSWGEAFEQASYQFTTDETTEIDSFSFAPDSSYFENGFTKYLWYKENFLPDRNFKVWFSNP